MLTQSCNQKGWILLFSMILLSFVQAARSDTSEHLAQKIENALQAEGYEDVIVEIQDEDHVRMEGRVDMMYDRLRIFDIASKFPGVDNVTNAVIVDAPQMPDRIIKVEVLDMFNLIDGIPDPNEIRVEVDNGVVQLLGKVARYKTKILAQTAASWVKGVKGIVNDIGVKPLSKIKTDESIRERIGDILENWYALTREGDVQYTVENGAVLIEGEVNSFWTKRELERDILNLVGVKKVENHLTVAD